MQSNDFNEIPSSTSLKESDKKLLEFFQKRGERKIYLPETTLFQQGEFFRQLSLIERGAVRLTRNNASGQEIIIELRATGDLLGAAAVITQEAAPITAITLTECVIYRLSVKVFLDLWETDIGFPHAVGRSISQQWVAQTDRLARMGTGDASANLAAFFLQTLSTSTWNSEGEFRLLLPCNKTTIAKLLAITPVHLSRLLKDMKNQEVIRENKGWIYIKDIEYLTRIAG